MALRNELEELKELKFNHDAVFSVYLNTDRSDQDQQKGEWQIHLKNGIKRIREYLEAANNDKELKSFEKLSKKVDKEIQNNRTDLLRSVVIFASEEADLFSVHYLQVPVNTSFHWENRPVLEPLEDIQREYPRTGIILPNMDEVKIIDTALGELHEVKSYEFDSGKEEWVLSEGMASSDRMASGATHVDKFQQRFKENLSRFYKDMNERVENFRRDRNWDHVYVIGEAETVKIYTGTMKKKPTGVMHKNLNSSKPYDVIKELYK